MALKSDFNLGVFGGWMISSRNYAPSARLLPFIRRHYVVEAQLPADFCHEDFLMADNSFVRVILAGEWDWWHQDQWVAGSGALLFGPNAHLLKIRVRGPIFVVGFAIRPSAWTALFDQPATRHVDLISPLAEAWAPELVSDLIATLAAATTDVDRVAALEAAIETQMGNLGRKGIDPVIATFETIARRDSTTRVEEAARVLGLSPRQLERRCLTSFGLSPKSVLQRCRFLDMAAAMRGLSNADQAELASLRYFDQSHLNREVRRYAGMTPGAFQKANMPLFTESLKLREEGKILA